MIDDGNRQLAIGRRGIAEFGRRKQVAERCARIERADRNGKIAAARLRIASGGLGLGVDQQCGEVGGGDLNRTDHEFGHEHRAIDDHYLGAIGQIDDQIAADRVDIGKLHASGKRHDSVGSGDDAQGIGLDEDRGRSGAEPLRRRDMGVTSGRRSRRELMLVRRIVVLRSAKRSVIVSHVLPFRHPVPETGFCSHEFTRRLTETVNDEVEPRAST